MNNGILRPVKWQEWDGHDYPDTEKVVYFSYGFIDITRPKHRNFLISTLQKDGLVDNKSEAYQALDEYQVVHGLVVHVDGDHILSYFNPELEYEEIDRPEPATWVEIDLGDN